MAEMHLTKGQRATILRELSESVKKNFYDPALRCVDWTSALEKHRNAILNAATPEVFEFEMSGLLAELGVSHVGFFRQRPERASARMAISATYAPESLKGQDYWSFQVIHDGGPAFKAGLKSGDVLLTVDGRNYRPPEHPIFPLGAVCSIKVLTDGLCDVTRELVIPRATEKKYQLPYVQPTLVLPKRLRYDIGYLRISMFPGLVGVDVANEISQAIRQLNPVERMIIDLRGNSGGGLAVVRLMSLLTPDQLPIGYSLHRSQAGMSPSRQKFPVFDRIPNQKWVLKWLSLKFGWRIAATKLGLRVKPVLLRTERTEAQPFYKRVVLLVDRHTASASEMVAAFVRENGLAMLVGEPTSGRLLDGDDFKLSAGYRVVLPVGAYHTARDWALEGSPIQPDVHVQFIPAVARAGDDLQLAKALEVVAAL